MFVCFYYGSGMLLIITDNFLMTYTCTKLIYLRYVYLSLLSAHSISDSSSENTRDLLLFPCLRSGGFHWNILTLITSPLKYLVHVQTNLALPFRFVFLSLASNVLVFVFISNLETLVLLLM